MAEDVDAVVIGMGPGGEAAAADLARAGVRVVGIERRLVGGECPYYACIPSKMMVRAAGLLAEAGRLPQMGGQTSVDADFGIVADRIRTEATDDWDDRVAVERFEAAGGRFVRGSARLAGPHLVQVDGQEFRAGRAVILNTGTDPAVPPVPGLASTPYWTNLDIVRITRPPASLAVLGGGTVGVEFAQALARFGTRVHVIEAAGSLLPAEEPESGRLVADVFEAEGIRVHTDANVQRVSHDGARFTLTLAGDEVTADRLLVATGRRNALAGLGLETIGLDPQADALPTDPQMRVADGVYAIGDITGRGAYTHMSVAEAQVAVADILGREEVRLDEHAVPRVTFTDPEIGAVGRTAAQAGRDGIAVDTGLAALSKTTRGWIHGPGAEGFVKLVADRSRGVLVGATAAGPAGGAMLGLLTLAVQERVPVARLRRLIHPFPTFQAAVGDALAELPARVAAHT